MSRLIRTLGILAIGVAAFAAAPAVADGPLTIVSPASGETLKMFSPMTLKIDPGFSIALDVDFGNFEVRVGGFKLGNVTLSQLRGGVTYALDPSVPLGMNELTINATRACQNGTNCPSYRTLLLPLTVQATRQVTIIQGDAGWSINVDSPKPSGGTFYSKIGQKILFRATSNLPDTRALNVFGSVPGSSPNQTGIEVSVGTVSAGVYTLAQLRKGVNWTVPNGPFPESPGLYDVTFTGPRICNVAIIPNCTGTVPISAMVKDVGVDGTKPVVTTTAARTTTASAAAPSASASPAANGTSDSTKQNEAATQTPTAAPAPSESALSIGAIAGIAVGGFVFLVAAAGLGYCLHRRRANQIEIEERYFGTEKMKEEQFGGVTAFHRNSWREPDMDVLAGQKRSSMLVLPNYSNVSISNSKSAREF